MTTTSFMNLQASLAPLESGLREAFERVLARGRFIMGEELAAFEAEFAAYCDSQHCIGVGNGLEALHLTLVAMGIGAGDEVIVPAHTFVATWLAVSMAGARPVPVDAGEDFNIDAQRVAAAITPRTRAIIAVHLYGLPADMQALRTLADQHGLKLIEDAAQAHGARCHNQRVGSLGDAACFSFYPTKNLGALGDGGAITTQDAALAKQLRKLRNYGSERKYDHEMLGFNSRLDELQAAFLRVRLAKLDADNTARRDIAAAYTAGLADCEHIALPRVASWAEPVWHLYVIRSSERDRLAAALAARGIDTLIHYPTPPHRQAAYAHLQWPALPVSERLAREILSLPMWPGLDPTPVIAELRRC